MSSAAVRAPFPAPVTSFPLERPLPEPGHSRLLELPRGVVPGSQLEVRPAPAVASSGIPEIDALSGGLPRGALTEIYGQASSGRTSLVLAALAEASRRQEACALVDASDSLHPESAAAGGMDLQRLLWIRCSAYSPQRHGDTEGIEELKNEECRIKKQRPPIKDQASAPRMNADQRGSELIHKSSIFNQPCSVAPFLRGESSQRLISAPRMNADQRGSELIHKSSIFNQPCSVAPCLRGESSQRLISAPRMNADQRGSGPIHKSSTFNHQSSVSLCLCGETGRQSSGWERRLEQVLKATDLLLQSGGFGMVVVDLGDVPPRYARRIPLASWFRFRRAVENTPTVVVVVEQEPYAKTCASLVLKMRHSAVSAQHSAHETLAQKCSKQFGEIAGQQSIFSHDGPAHAQILHGLPVEAEIVHARFQRKPARSAAQFRTRPAWSDSVAG